MGENNNTWDAVYRRPTDQEIRELRDAVASSSKGTQAEQYQDQEVGQGEAVRRFTVVRMRLNETSRILHLVEEERKARENRAANLEDLEQQVSEALDKADEQVRGALGIVLRNRYSLREAKDILGPYFVKERWEI